MSLAASTAKPSTLSRAFALCKGQLPLRKSGMELLRDCAITKGTGFTLAERDRLRIRGLVPHKVFTLDEQVERLRRRFHLLDSMMQKYVFLSCERERNEAVFWRFLFTEPPENTMPVLYTPTVGEACQKWATHRPSYRGIYITPEDTGHMKEILRNYHEQDIRCIVVSDGGRILGLGDLGASGLGIPVGKLMLYTIIGQVNPKYSLPVLMDLGCDTKAILDDPLYHGWRHQRLFGLEHQKYIEEFVEAVMDVFGPTCLVQFEDFQMETAFSLLDYFRPKCNCFNDDIEGTAAVAAAAAVCGTRVKGCPSLADQKWLFIGAGSAAIGIANLIVDIAHDTHNIPKEQLYKNIVMFDAGGMVTSKRTDLFDFNKPYMHEIADADKPSSVLDACKKLKITGIIGVSGCPGLITKEIVETMCQNCERPMVFALSNPTSQSECSAAQAYEWSNEKALFASGSPFPNYTTKAGKTLVPSQANNSWIFPGVGLALVSCQAKHCPAKVFQIAAEALAMEVKPEDLEKSSLLPPLSQIRHYSFPVALAVSEYLYKEGLATHVIEPGVTLEQYLRSEQFNPAGTYESVY